MYQPIANERYMLSLITTYTIFFIFIGLSSSSNMPPTTLKSCSLQLVAGVLLFTQVIALYNCEKWSLHSSA